MSNRYSQIRRVCTRAIPVLKRWRFVIEPVIFRTVRVANIHQTVGMQHEFFRDLSAHKQNFGRVFLEEKILGEPRADDRI